MTLRVCMDCTTAFAVGAPRCPHCGSERSAEEGTAAALGVYARGRVEEDDMPKITRHGGASDKALREHAQNLGEPDFSESLVRLEAEDTEPPAEEVTPAPKKTTARRKRPVRDTSRDAE